jgi:prefoldin subunit 5
VTREKLAEVHAGMQAELAKLEAQFADIQPKYHALGQQITATKEWLRVYHDELDLREIEEP